MGAPGCARLLQRAKFLTINANFEAITANQIGSVSADKDFEGRSCPVLLAAAQRYPEHSGWNDPACLRSNERGGYRIGPASATGEDSMALKPNVKPAASTEPNSKRADFDRNPICQRRVVVFYD
jgi:hypothetical protein